MYISHVILNIFICMFKNNPNDCLCVSGDVVVISDSEEEDVVMLNQ